MNFIQNLQNKPEGQKKLILFLIVGILMIFVFCIWFFQFKKSLNSRTNITKNNLTSVTELTENVSDVYKNTSKKIDEIKGILKEIE